MPSYICDIVHKYKQIWLFVKIILVNAPGNIQFERARYFRKTRLSKIKISDSPSNLSIKLISTDFSGLAWCRSHKFNPSVRDKSAGIAFIENDAFPRER